MAEVPRILTPKEKNKQYWLEKLHESRTETLKEIEALLTSGRPLKMKKGIIGAGWAVAEEFVELLIPFLKHPVSMLNEEVTTTLGKIPRAFIPFITPMPPRDMFPNEYIGGLMLLRVKKWGNPVLENMLRDGDESQVRMAMSVCFQRRFCPFELLSTLLQSEEDFRQDAAIRILGHCGPTEAVAHLAAVVETGSRKAIARIESALTVRARRDRKAVAAALESAPPLTLQQAMLATALSKVQDARAQAPGLALLETGNPRLVIQGLRILRRLRTPEAIGPIVRLLESPQENIRAVALDAAGRLRHADMLPALRENFESENEIFRRLAWKALKKYRNDGSFAGHDLPDLEGFS